MPRFHTVYSEPTPAQYEAIGRVAATWSLVEFGVEQILARLAGAPDLPALALTNDLSMDNRLTALRNLIAMHRSSYGNQLVAEEWLSKLDSARTEISTAKELRNKIVHLIWFRTDDKRMFGTKFKGRPRSGEILAPWELEKTVAELCQFASDLEDLGSRLFDLAEQIPDIARARF